MQYAEQTQHGNFRVNKIVACRMKFIKVSFFNYEREVRNCELYVLLRSRKKSKEPKDLSLSGFVSELINSKLANDLTITIWYRM